MRIELSHSLDDYINSGDETTRELLARGGSLIDATRLYYAFFVETLWAGEINIPPIPAVVAMNAFFLYLSGTRTAMTGHVAAIFPVLRAALESACYAFLMVDDPALENVWSERNRDKESHDLCRRKFSPAVRLTVDKLNELQADSGDWIMEAYEAAIDYGAHPNPRSVFRHVSISADQGDKFHRVSFTGLYASDAEEVSTALIACLEYGLAVLIILSRCLDDFPATGQARLFELNEIKERLVAERMAR